MRLIDADTITYRVLPLNGQSVAFATKEDIDAMPAYVVEDVQQEEEERHDVDFITFASGEEMLARIHEGEEFYSPELVMYVAPCPDGDGRIICCSMELHEVIEAEEERRQYNLDSWANYVNLMYGTCVYADDPLEACKEIASAKWIRRSDVFDNYAVRYEVCALGRTAEDCVYAWDETIAEVPVDCQDQAYEIAEKFIEDNKVIYTNDPKLHSVDVVVELVFDEENDFDGKSTCAVYSDSVGSIKASLKDT